MIEAFCVPKIRAFCAPKIRAFSRASHTYDEAAVLAREVGRSMVARLEFVNIAPVWMADIGCATGEGIVHLQKRYPTACPLAVDFSEAMLRKTRGRSSGASLVAANVTQLPLSGGCLDLVWSNLMLHWVRDVRVALREIHQAMAPGGLLVIAMLGSETLTELRAAGATHLPRFHGMREIGDMLASEGFADIVMDREKITLTYGSPRGFLRDQRHLGVRDELLGYAPWRQWRKTLTAWPLVEGRRSASFEVIYGHAWKARA